MRAAISDGVIPFRSPNCATSVCVRLAMRALKLSSGSALVSGFALLIGFTCVALVDLAVCLVDLDMAFSIEWLNN